MAVAVATKGPIDAAEGFNGAGKSINGAAKGINVNAKSDGVAAGAAKIKGFTENYLFWRRHENESIFFFIEILKFQDGLKIGNFIWQSI